MENLMTDKAFNALVLNQNEDRSVSATFETLANDQLPKGDTVVSVQYSSLNYKDGMVLGGLGRLVRDYPHVPGVDFVGTVETCTTGMFKPGDQVICTGWRVGEAHWGGYATRASVQSDWLVPLPKALSPKQAMAIGTAGLAAMMSVMALEDHGLTPDCEGDVLVTGAAGGVGSIAVAILANLGYGVSAGTGRDSTHDYLKGLGATNIVSREDLEQAPRGPLAKECWAGAIDNVGGPILSNLLAALKHGGSCAAVGLAASPLLETTVLPFLLRGVNMLGIDTVACPTDRRIVAWNRFVSDLPLKTLDDLTEVHGLSDVVELGQKILDGQVQGRIVIDVNR